MKRRIILAYNDESCEWEWAIQQYWAKAHTWIDIPGDDFGGGNETIEEALSNAQEAMNKGEQK